MKEGCVGQLEVKIREEFDESVNHINIKRIKARDFEDDKENPACRVLQVDFAMNYSCEHQNQVQSRESVILFTAAVMHAGNVTHTLFALTPKANTKTKWLCFWIGSMT